MGKRPDSVVQSGAVVCPQGIFHTFTEGLVSGQRGEVIVPALQDLRAGEQELNRQL